MANRPSIAAAPGGTRGGRRRTSLRSQYSAQVIAMTLPDIKKTIEEVGEEFGISQSEIARRAIDHGLAKAVKEIRATHERRLAIAPDPE